MKISCFFLMPTLNWAKLQFWRAQLDGGLCIYRPCYAAKFSKQILPTSLWWSAHTVRKKGAGLRLEVGGAVLTVKRRRWQLRWWWAKRCDSLWGEGRGTYVSSLAGRSRSSRDTTAVERKQVRCFATWSVRLSVFSLDRSVSQTVCCVSVLCFSGYQCFYMYQGFFGFAIIIAFQIIFSVGLYLQLWIKSKILWHCICFPILTLSKPLWYERCDENRKASTSMGSHRVGYNWSDLAAAAALIWASQVAQLVKNLPAMLETPFNSWVRKFPWRRDRLPTPVFLDFPGDSTGKESSCNVRDWGLTPALGKSLGGGHGNWLPVFLPGESPWTEEPCGLQSLGSQSVGHDRGNKHITAAQHFFPGGCGRVSS